MHISEFDYSLPAGSIADAPAHPRDTSRLMVIDRATGERQHRRFSELPELLSPGDLIVVNRSAVFPARLIGERSNGSKAEVLLVRELEEGYWEALLRPGARLRRGDRVRVSAELSVEVEDGPGSGTDGLRHVRFIGSAPADELLERYGRVPLPPYIRREARPEDRNAYQTVYAQETGSVAAPTAGLHFTPELLDRLLLRGIDYTEVVLHVGPGTFRPVQVEQVEDHRVAPENFYVPEATSRAIQQARDRGGRVVAIGTTTVRTLEAQHDGARGVRSGAGKTDLVICPGYPFKVIDALVTNFHLPRSSLLLLVCAFAGRKTTLDAYREAIGHGYRFYSYGDAMLVT